jgi:DNA-binding transcriptional LysR family regulator
MELRQLKYFVAVAEELSFTRAAAKLNISQPPLSMQIKALEEEMGTQLFERTRRKVDITPAGLLLLEHARTALQELNRASELVTLSSRGAAGVIRVGFTGSVPLLGLFPRLMRAFRDEYPNMEVDLRHMSTTRQLQAIIDKTLDVGILRPPYQYQPGPRINAYPIWNDQLIVFFPTSHRLLSARNAIDMEDLADEDFVGIGEDVGCGMREHFMVLCSQAGFVPRIVQKAQELNSVLGLVAAGIGIAVLPECYAKFSISSVVNRELTTKAAQSQLLLTTGTRDVPSFVKNFIGVARRTFEIC